MQTQKVTREELVMDSMTVVMQLEAIRHLILHVILMVHIQAMVNIQAHIATHGQAVTQAHGIANIAQRIKRRPKYNNKNKHRINVALV
jgi:hypothetical protein